MKRKFGLLIIVVLLSLPLFAAGQQEGVSSSPGRVKHLSVVTGPVGGPMYAISGAWSAIINRDISGIKISNQVGGGSAYTARILGNKEADFAMVGNDVAYYAYKGGGEYDNPNYQNFRGVAALYAESFHAVVPKNSGIKFFEDFKGKSIAIGPPGSGTLVTNERILDAYGYSKADVGAKELGFNESAEYLRDGHVDAALYTTGLPYGPIVDISMTKPIDIIGLNDAAIKKLTNKYPFYVPTIVPAGTYKGVGDFKTVSVKMLLITTTDMDEELVYQVTKSLYENLDSMKASHATATQIKLENGTAGIPIPLHPGAERYYREMGIVK